MATIPVDIAVRSVRSLLIVLILLQPGLIRAQSVAPGDTIFRKIDPGEFAKSIDGKLTNISEKFTRSMDKALFSFQKLEQKIYRKLLKTKDSLQARITLEGIKERYAAIRKEMGSSPRKQALSQYVPNLDTLLTSLTFLELGNSAPSISHALASANVLKDKIQQAERLKSFIKERREQLKVQLESLGLMKNLKRINKNVYYFSAQVNSYKEAIGDRKKLESKALEILSKSKAWKDFFRKNSVLASLFRLPDTDHESAAVDLTGLQSRTQVATFLQEQLRGADPVAHIQQQIQEGKAQVDLFKNKLNNLNGGNEEEMAGFKPNHQKNKSFLKRLEYGTSFQSQRSTAFFPVTTDLGLSLGYKLNDKSIIGLGASYKMGWGRGWNHLKLSHEGIGLRSFVDIQMKGSFWISGGYEQNFRTAFANFEQLRSMNGWQQSGLIGISKQISLKSKLFKKSSVKLYWDFLSYQQIPRSQPLIFRIGYSIK